MFEHMSASATLAASHTETWMSRAATVIPGGVNSGRRRVDPPLVAAWMRGAHIGDVDGREYIDFYGGAGTAVLGHAAPQVTEAVSAAVADGLLSGAGTTTSEIELAEQLTGHFVSADQVLICNSGSEATLYALRLARSITGRDKIIKFQGHYHGHHDAVFTNVHSAPERVGTPDPHSAGMLAPVLDRTLICRYNDLDDVRATLQRHAGQVAAVIVEPVMHNGPTILPDPEFLQGLRALTREHGALMIADEVITGFRHVLGSYTESVGVHPDLIVIGKAVANGFPLGALVGPSDLMQRWTTVPEGDTAWAGTYNGNSASVAAALATITTLADTDAIPRIAGLGQRMRDGLARIVADRQIPATVTGHGSIFTLWFRHGPIRSYDQVIGQDAELFRRYRTELRHRGVFEKPDPDGARSLVSAAHTEQDIDFALQAAADALTAAIR
jgi:glutamate-1-semialdehyde 2,1-aminomutase